MKDSDRNRILLELISDFTYFYVQNSHDNENKSHDYKLERITDSFFNVTGYDKKNLDINQSWLCTVHPEDQQIAKNQLERAKPGSKEVAEFRILDSDGESIWLKNYIYCVEAERWKSYLWGGAEHHKN